MLKDFVKVEMPEEEELKAKLKEERMRLSAFQMKIKEAGLPVMVLFEGWNAAGKGAVIGKVIRNIDPRFFKVATMDREPSPEEKRYPFLYRYIKEIPEAGKFRFFDTCWMEEVVSGVIEGNLTDEVYKKRVHSINVIERQLVDNGYLVIKFFFHISKKEQKKRLDDLRSSKDTKWRVDKNDLLQNKHYDKILDVFERYLEDTNESRTPWYIIDAKDKKFAELQVLQFLNQGIDIALKNQKMNVPILQNTFPMEKIGKLSDISLDGKVMSDAEYDAELDRLQKELKDLGNKVYRKKIPVIIAYEGWDAAGKGGNIKRITEALDPRDFVVEPIASPEPHEKARHYLWRFWTRLPKTGHITVFDRTWYGRVMVERLEGFCSENDWQRAYNEINEFEKELKDWGAVIIKFWVQIDKDTQLKRFNDRQNTPEKQWKITDEDWRNREKWDLYETAIDEMIEKTSTAFAPWYVLESVDKKYARIKALKIVIEEIKKAIE
ncbi:polyphosphate:AMP phosphotransferase [Butyrivibrio sp. CB08]|uniref:polyphosphate:AMP phosphotransferase n=1 Tax=Butyrivibrio sp. CB08 TaxID=2364879 RepID=UPI000EA988F3|nr:polyphosphate:AMP phosphotransferase [Butyrivibrio sp. CB08]RKM59933.1 polyphosphate:AMP phosphotransferase [Butyrivibrio sp. CB08]